MTSKTNSYFNDASILKIIEFNITENIKKIGIKELTLKERDFLIIWSDGRESCVEFNYKLRSIERNIKSIQKRLWKELKDKLDEKSFELAINELEEQIIKRREEIFNLNEKQTSGNDSDNEYKSKFLEDVSILRERFENLSDPYSGWESEVQKKYNKLYEIMALLS